MKFYQTQQEFIESKKTTLGASEVGAILGVSKFETPFQLFQAKKSGEVKDMNKYMEAGKMLEDSIVNRFYESRGEEFVRDVDLLSYSHPEYNFIIVHPDNIYKDTFLIEAKTTQKYLNQETTYDYVYNTYFPQWNFTLGIVKENQEMSDEGYLLVFSRGVDYTEVQFKFDKEAYEYALAAAIVFNERLFLDIAPELQGNDFDLVYTLDNGQALFSTSQMEKEFKELVTIRKALKELESEEERLITYFKSEMKDRQRIVNSQSGRLMTTWNTGKRGRTFRVYDD